MGLGPKQVEENFTHQCFGYIHSDARFMARYMEVHTQNCVSDLGSLSLDLVTFTSPISAFVQKKHIETNLATSWTNFSFHSVGNVDSPCPRA